jgi:aminomethyltransferase
MEAALSFSPLDQAHRALSAKMVPFGGWDMPLSYPSGTVAEHLACRRSAVMFDVSHLGTMRVEGPGAFDRLQAALTNDLRKIAPGRAQYTHLLDEADGSVLDDIIVWWVADEVFDVMPNASNTERVVEAIGGRDTTSSRAVIAVQGPAARQIVGSVAAEIAAVGRFKVAVIPWNGTLLTVAGTGYTGEAGLEIAVPVDHAAELWDALLAGGVQPAGLGARDTLRLEAGLPLHGHELGPGITPLQAGLGWVIGWDKDDFRGRSALVAERDRGPHRMLRGIATEGRRPPREGSAVLVNGAPVGEVTSGNFSPILEHGIALGWCHPDLAIGDQVAVDVRGTQLAGTIVATPFVKASPST